jgi:hypothetical protein
MKQQARKVGKAASGRRVWLSAIVSALFVAACARDDLPLPANEAPTGRSAETREFEVSVDGKRAGQYRMEITRPDHRTLVMTGQAAVKVRYLIYTYSYRYQGTETYRDGRLVSLKSTSNDNGSRFAVSARADGDRLLITINGKDHFRPGDVWTTSFWQLAAGTGHAITLLEPDTGKMMQGRARYLEKVKLHAAGREMECRHFRVSGTPSPVDLWYDEEGRLVRQDYLDDGHRTVLELKTLTR